MPTTDTISSTEDTPAARRLKLWLRYLMPPITMLMPVSKSQYVVKCFTLAAPGRRSKLPSRPPVTAAVTMSERPCRSDVQNLTLCVRCGTCTRVCVCLCICVSVSVFVSVWLHVQDQLDDRAEGGVQDRAERQ